MASVYDVLRGTMQAIFRIGKGGPQLKNNSGVIESRNADDSDFVVHRGADPVANQDFVTKNYLTNQPSEANDIKVVEFAIGTATVSSVKQIPANSKIKYVAVETTTGYNVGATITIGNAATPALLMAAAENDPEENGAIFQKTLNEAWSGADEAVKATISATAGAGKVTVHYTVSPDA